jgi:ferredoxin/flavodoxin---NADP+ reductase
LPNYKVAIVGASPAGYIAAQALQSLQIYDLQFTIDVIERLPTPWGLVRSGVVLDHPKIKTGAKGIEKIATAGNFRLVGRVELGTDISIEPLKEM